MKEAFIEKDFSKRSLGTIQIVNAILAEYEKLGYDLSLRQLYYQMVARAYIENSQRSYKNFGSLVNDARLAGLFDWNMIIDRGRQTVTPPHWTSPAEIVEAAASQFAIDKWADQMVHVEDMVEKQALEGVLIPVCEELDIRFTANKGYSSSSTMYETGKRLARYQRMRKQIWILYLGDHDPSGIDMTRDIDERLRRFSGIDLEVNRLALNFDQVEQWNPPENPAKETDARYGSYVSQYGDSSWELDAIEPRTLANLVRTAVTGLRDPDIWAEAEEREADMKNDLHRFASTYSKGR